MEIAEEIKANGAKFEENRKKIERIEKILKIKMKGEEKQKRKYARKKAIKSIVKILSIGFLAIGGISFLKQVNHRKWF